MLEQLLPENQAGRLATTSITNEMRRMLNRHVMASMHNGQVNESDSAPLARPQMIGVKNKSGADVPQFGVLGLDAPTFSPEDTDPLGFQIDGVLPTTADHAGGHFAIVIQGLAATGSSEGEFGYAVVSGVVKAWVNVTDEAHQFADVKHEDVTQLESGDTGSARILAKDSGTGKKLCVVLLAAGTPAPGLAMLRITQNGSAGGQYRGRVQVVADDWEFDPAEDYSLTDRYNDASTNSADDVYVVAVIDGNSTRRAVPLNSYHWGRRIGTHDDKAVYEIQGFAPASIASV